MAVDDRTTNLSLALPSPSNLMSTEDVPRLREAFTALDTIIHSLQLALAAKADSSAIADAVSSLVNGAPGALDQLNELAAALGDDPNFSTTILTALAGKLSNAPATSTNLGGVKVGSGLIVDVDGTISVVFSSGGSGLPAYSDLYIVPGTTTNTITVSGGYNPGQIDVQLNGVPLYDGGDDYTATNGTTIVFASPVTTADKLKVRRWIYIPAEQALNKTGDTMTGAFNEAAPVTVASAGVLNIGVLASNNVTITGTTAITSFGTYAAGAKRTVTFTDALVLTHNVTSLILPGGSNIATAAGDVAVMQSLGSGNWRCISYTRADGSALVGGLVSVDASGTTVTALAGQHIRLLNAAASTATAPASPVSKQRWRVSVCNGRSDNVIDWNGAKHENSAETQTVLDDPFASPEWEFIDATYGWKLLK